MKIHACSILMLLFLLGLSSCRNDDNLCTAGAGAIAAVELDLSDFNAFDLAIAAEVNVTQGSPQRVQASGNPNVINGISTAVTNGFWNIGFADECYNYEELRIDIVVADIRQVFVSGSGDIDLGNFSNQSSLDVQVSGSGNIVLNEMAGLNTLDIAIPGSGNITANRAVNDVETLNIRIPGSGNYAGFLVGSRDCTVDVEGSGDVELTATETLDISISGSGTVFYKGSPTIT